MEIRPLFLRCLLLIATSSVALSQPTLAQLEQAATKAHDDWFKLASDLDVRVARMLPCDAAAISAIEETNKASTSRLVALTNYARAAADQAAKDVAVARQIQRAETAALTSVGTERTDTEQERAGIETQINNLAESVRKKVTLTAAADELKELEAAVRERANMVTTNASAAEGSLKSFEDLAVALERRESAIRKQIAALEDERIKWNGYYTARLARARIECTVTGTGR